MKNISTSALLSLLVSMLLSVAVFAGGDYQRTVKIGLKTDDFSIEDVDLSHLEVGDSETIYTEEGKEAVFTRTEDGFELSVNGKTIDLMHDRHHGKGQIKIHRRHCEDGEDCQDRNQVIVLNNGSGDDGQHVSVIAHSIVKSQACDDSDDCDVDVQVWSGQDGELIELLGEDGALLELHSDIGQLTDESIWIEADGNEGHKVIIIEEHEVIEGEEI